MFGRVCLYSGFFLTICIFFICRFINELNCFGTTAPELVNSLIVLAGPIQAVEDSSVKPAF